MAYDFGKAFSGGRAISEDEMRKLPAEQFDAMRGFFRKPNLEQTDDVIDQRLSEELQSVKRMLENLEQEVAINDGLVKQLDNAEEAIDDVADIVGAADKCEAIDHSDDDMKRRLLRRSLDGRGTPCDNQVDLSGGSRIRKKADN